MTLPPSAVGRAARHIAAWFAEASAIRLVERCEEIGQGHSEPTRDTIQQIQGRCLATALQVAR